MLLFERTPFEGRAVRLLGVATSHLGSGAARQLDLFESADQLKTDRLDHALDGIRQRLGADAVRRGRLLEDSKRPPKKPCPPKDKG